MTEGVSAMHQTSMAWRHLHRKDDIWPIVKTHWGKQLGKESNFNSQNWKRKCENKNWNHGIDTAYSGYRGIWNKSHQWPRFIDTLSFLKFHFSFWYDDLLMTRQHHRAGHLQIISHNEGAPNITLRIRRIISIMCLPLWKKSIRSLLEHMVWMRINSVEAIIVIISVIHLRLQWH